MLNYEVKKRVSIQVQTVKCTGGGVEVIPQTNCKQATDWAFYFRYEDGAVKWIKDIPILENNPSKYYAIAMVEAAKLSMEFNLPIERIK